MIAETPIRTIDKGTVTTEFVAAVLVNKYCDHLPIYRQTGRLLKSAKVDVAESNKLRIMNYEWSCFSIIEKQILVNLVL